jgi:hypothetical protein
VLTETGATTCRFLEDRRRRNRADVLLGQAARDLSGVWCPLPFLCSPSRVSMLVGNPSQSRWSRCRRASQWADAVVVRVRKAGATANVHVLVVTG